MGGASFELTRAFDEVVGIDFSHAFVAAANDMKANGHRDYHMLVEGSIMEQKTATVPKGAMPDRVQFAQVQWRWEYLSHGVASARSQMCLICVRIASQRRTAPSQRSWSGLWVL